MSIRMQIPIVEGQKVHTWESVSTVQYLGNKARILPQICPDLLSIKGVDTFVDLFAGTGSVSFALKEHFQIYANDLQRYSYVMLEGLLNGAVLSEEVERRFFSEAKSFYVELAQYVSGAIEKEKEFFDADSQGVYEAYREFCEDTPTVFSPTSTCRYFDGLKHLCSTVKPGQGHSSSLPVLFLTYYSNAYFGISQSCEIDALRYVIDKVKDRHQQHVLLLALMSAMSSTVSATTHFAQFLKIRDLRTADNLLSKRRLSIMEQMRLKLREFRSKSLLSQSVGSAKCGNMDYLEFLNSIPLGDNTLVYADPPYFKEHYSRYYHVLETLCLYDYPELTFNPRTKTVTTGRYRQDRAVSPFGKKSSALGAFKTLVETCGRNSAPIAISYSDNSIVRVEDIVGVCEEWFDVSTKLIPLKHSSQGRGMSNGDVNEVFIVGAPRRKLVQIGQAKVDALLSTLSEMEPVYDNPAGAMHNYMARKPYNVVNTIISTLLPEPGVVLDPFCGSGTMLIESRKCGHRSVGIDINKQATLISEVSQQSWDLALVEREVTAFLESVQEAIEDLYKVVIEQEQRIVERCHFDLVCGRLHPTAYWYKTVLRSGKLSPRKKAVPDTEFHNQFSALERRAESLFSDKDLMPNSRIAIPVGATVADYFCPRNRLAIARLLTIYEQFQDVYSRDVIELLLSSSLNLIKLSDKKASSQIPYWRPKTNLTSRNALWILQEKANAVLEGLQFLDDVAPGTLASTHEELGNKPRSTLVINSPVQRVSNRQLPPNTIDLVVTDPPYTDQVPYLEYSQLWSLLLGWNNLEQRTLSDELIVSNASARKDKNLDDFNSLLTQSLKRIATAMKPMSHLAMFFHDFSLRAWSSLIKSAESAGLAYQGQVVIGRQRRSFKTVLSPQRTLDGNYLIVFRKRELHPPLFQGDLMLAVEECVDIAREIIKNNGGYATSQDLYDKGLLKYSIESGSIHLLSMHFKTFLDIIKKEFVFDSGIWSDG